MPQRADRVLSVVRTSALLPEKSVGHSWEEKSEGDWRKNGGFRDGKRKIWRAADIPPWCSKNISESVRRGRGKKSP